MKRDFRVVTGRLGPEFSKTEHSEREHALKLPPREIKRAEFRDRNRYTGAMLRRFRKACGVGRLKSI
jgi:hypothetical protein